MRKANKKPSEWLQLLCKDWAAENAVLVEATDAKFHEYKSYMKGVLSPQLLCRLSCPPTNKDGTAIETGAATVDFWGILGIQDEFDKSYVVAQIERFSSLYTIRGGPLDEMDGALFPDQVGPPMDVTTAAAAAAAGITVSPTGGIVTLSPYLSAGMDANAAAAAGKQRHVVEENV